MRVLIIDDDIEIREPIISAFWKRQNPDAVLVWLTSWPIDFIEYLEQNPDITYISFDHDLGNTDVSSELNKLQYLMPEKYASSFKNKNIVIHSMNPVGAQNIYYKLSHVAKSVFICPLSAMER